MGIRTITYQQAMREALQEEMRRDGRVFIMGEDVAVLGGGFGVTRGMMDEFGEERIRDTAISESAIVGAAIGAALNGLRPVCEIQFCDLLLCAMDQVANQAAKMRYMMGGRLSVPIVIRTTYGTRAGTGGQHAQTIYGAFLQFPGLKIVAPSCVQDGKGLLLAAIRDPDPVLFFEHRFLYALKEEIDDSVEEIPLGTASVKREGDSITIIAIGQMVQNAMQAASRLTGEGIEAEVIDLRSIIPFDRETVLKSVMKTNRVVIVDEGPVIGGVASEISAFLMENAFDYLDAPVKRLATVPVPPPYEQVYIRAIVPSADDVFMTSRKMVKGS